MLEQAKSTPLQTERHRMQVSLSSLIKIFRKAFPGQTITIESLETDSSSKIYIAVNGGSVLYDLQSDQAYAPTINLLKVMEDAFGQLKKRTITTST